jgi:hypothetical protein
VIGWYSAAGVLDPTLQGHQPGIERRRRRYRIAGNMLSQIVASQLDAVGEQLRSISFPATGCDLFAWVIDSEVSERCKRLGPTVGMPDALATFVQPGTASAFIPTGSSASPFRLPRPQRTQRPGHDGSKLRFSRSVTQHSKAKVCAFGSDAPMDRRLPVTSRRRADHCGPRGGIRGRGHGRHREL